MESVFKKEGKNVFFVCGPSGTSQLPEKRIRPNAQIPVMFMQSTTKVGNKEFLTFMMVRR